jgi:hypothetical protein
MRTATALVLVVLLLLTVLPGCRMNERLSGTVFGTVGGATVGGALSGSFAGGLVGALAGGVAGYIVGDYIADRRERTSYAPQPATYGPGQPTTAPAVGPGYGTAPRVGAARAIVTTFDASEAAIARGRRADTLPEARAAYEDAVRLDPNNADAWNALGLTLHMSGNGSGAEQAFRRALSIDPDHFAARRNLAWTQGGPR